MMTSPGPFNIAETRFILKPDGSGSLEKVTPDFYERLVKDYPDFTGHAMVSRHTFCEAWSTWEIHPVGDEMVYLLSGDTDFVLMVAGKEQIIRVNEPGSFVVVPKNTWHTARPHRETTMLFITPGEGTINAAEPPVDEPGAE